MKHKYLIFGGTGSLGQKLIDNFCEYADVYVYSRDEAKHFTIKNRLKNKQFNGNVNFIVGDIRDKDRIREVINYVNPHTVIVAAALKQVDTCEASPKESVLTNLIGTQNVLDAIDIIQKKPKQVLFVSTDKACSPVNVYGMCKSISERLISSQTVKKQEKQLPYYLCVRYGNVLESRGSIIPLFKYQSQYSKKLTVTDPDMTRFLMTLDDSVSLIKTTLVNGDCGETWVPHLASMRIGDLAEIFAEISGKDIEIIGHRPGEKKHEDLINETESLRTRLRSINGNDYYIIENSMNYSTINKNCKTYSSNQNVLTKQQLKNYLNELKIIDAPLSSFTGRQIEEIREND